MLDDTTKMLLGPLLALIPILIWELAIKPARTRRNIALLLMSEVELNLEEIAYYLVVREEDQRNHLVNMLLPRASFTTTQTSLGELPPADVRAVLRFYALTNRIEATHIGLAATHARLERAAPGDERTLLDAALDQGLRSLDAVLADAWAAGVDVRESLDELIRTGWMDAPPPAESAESIRADARARRLARLGTK